MKINSEDIFVIIMKLNVALLERFNGFIPGGSGNVCVHDSEGEHWLVTDPDQAN